MKIDVYKHSQLILSLNYLNEDLLNENKVFVGRSEDCHIVLDDHQISREHISFYIVDNQFVVENLSTYGDFIKSGQEVKAGEKVNLRENEVILLSDFELKVSEAILVESSSSEDIMVDDDKTQMLPMQNEDEDKTEILEEENVTEKLNEEFGEPVLESELDDEPLVMARDDEDTQSFESSETFSDESDGFESEAGFESDEEGFGEDSGFGDDDSGFGDDSGFESDSGESTQVFKTFAKYYLVLDGEFAPFDRYLIEDNEILIGRNPDKCQIYLNDSEVSGVHAVIKKTLINCFIEDQNSSNGTIYNGSRVNKAELVNGDSFQIGSTLFRVEIKSELIDNESDTLMPVADGQFVEVEEIVEEEVEFGNEGGEGSEFGEDEVKEKSLIKRIMKDPKKKRIVIFGGVALILMMLLGEDEPAKPVKKSKKTETSKEATKAGGQAKVDGKDLKKTLSKETLEKLEENYLLALSRFDSGEYYAAKEYLEVIRGIAPDYKDTQTLRKLVEEGLKELLKQKAREEEEKERKARQLKIEAILEKARAAVEKREVAVAESLFSQILEIDPENIDVPQLKLVIDAHKAEIERKRNEEIRKKELRKNMVDALAPGKALYLKEEWFKAIDRLGKFTASKGMDEDLIKEATQMLKDSKKKLSSAISPLLGQARSLKEGQDLKRSYEKYGDVLKFDPSNEEALNERDKIFEELRVRSMKLYREALISENLSLFEEARDQFKEVQQISPINSEYYNKATEKLKDYLE